VPSTRALIHAPWSASKVSTGLRCPRLFHFKYVDKLAEPEVMPETRIGKAIHKAIELVMQGTPLGDAVGTVRAELPNETEQRRFDQLAHGIPAFTSRIGQFRRRRRVGRQLVEYSLAIREDLTTTQFYSGDAYYRGVLDLGYLFDDDTLALVDHKTGSRIPGTSIVDQLEGYVVLAAAAFRHAKRFWLGVHWVAERAVEWSPPVGPEKVIDDLVPDLLDNIEAAALAVSDGPRVNPGPWCDRCAYRAVCPEGNEARFEPVEYYEDDDD
jgi:PD-(D/E)XK nuclease superfamily